MEADARGSSKVCVLLESERPLRDARDQSHLPHNLLYCARLQEDIIFRRLGLQRGSCAASSLEHRKKIYCDIVGPFIKRLVSDLRLSRPRAERVGSRGRHRVRKAVIWADGRAGGPALREPAAAEAEL